MSFPRSVLRVVVCILLSAVFVGSLFGLPNDKQLFQEAESRFRNRDYAFSLERYEILISNYPLSEYVPDAQYRRAMCLYRLQRIDEAYALFARVEIRYASTRYAVFVPFWKGVIEYGNGDYSASTQSLERYLASGESSLRNEAFLYKALSDKESGNPDRALESLEALFREAENPHEEPHALSLAATLYIQVADNEALKNLYDTIDPSLVADDWKDNVSLYKAESLWRNGFRDDSEKWYRDLTNAGPTLSSVAFQRLFTLARGRGDEDLTRDLLYRAETTLAGQPEILREFWLRVGIESYRQGKADLAASYLRRIWEIGSPENQDGLVPLYYSTILFEAGKTNEAMNVLDAYLAVGSDQRDSLLLRRGSIHLESGSWSKAGNDYSEYIAAYPEKSKTQEARYLKAFALYKNDDTRDALAAVRDAMSQGPGEYTSKLLLLESELHRKDGNTALEIQALENYLSLMPTDQNIRVDLATAYFRSGRYGEVLKITTPFLENDALSPTADREEVLLRYLAGLSLITEKEYEGALEQLGYLKLDDVREAGMTEIYPYALFYRGWSMYRLSRYRDAVAVFDTYLRGAGGHALQPMAAYLAGWCSFSLGEYRDAESYLSLIPIDADPGLWQKGSFMYGKTLIGMDMPEKASQAFETLFVGFPDSPFADDAIFEYASLLANEGRIDDALKEYDRLYITYPEGPLAEEGLFKKGEQLFDADRFTESREAFYQHRLSFPKGKLLDASLYWGGMASVEAGEEFGAVLLWEKLIYQFKESPFRSDAMRRTALVYEDSGDYREAFKLYSELIAVYPKVAAAVQADERAEKLRFLLLGQSEREAELSVIIGRENGSTTAVGREAIIELSRIYIYKSGDKQDTARKMLQEVVKRADEDPSSAARAEYLLGEYYYRKNVLDRAASAFLEAATMYPDDPDLTASSLLRAAEMLDLSGKTDDTEFLVGRIVESFPGTQWATEAKKLLEDD